MSNTESMIKVENLTKYFPGKNAVQNLDFEVEKGKIVGLLGPNGAGKTTTMRILSGFLSASSGQAVIDGFDVTGNSLEVRRKIGYLPENVPLYPELRVNEYLSYRGSLKGLNGRKLRDRIDYVLTFCGLENERKSIIGQLSKGYRQRVGLADALLGKPSVLILDEPTAGLDPIQIRRMHNQIRQLAPQHTILLSSHILHEVETTCERVMIMNKGKIVASGPPARLVAMLKGNPHLTVEIKGESVVDVHSELMKINHIRSVRDEILVDGWGRYNCECDRDSDPRSTVFKVVSSKCWALREMSMEKQNLEDVFVAMTEHAHANPDDDIETKSSTGEEH